MEEKKPGYVYILTNPSFRDDWVKIGMSSRPVDVRSKELDNTSIPLPFEIYATMRTTKYVEAEKLIHRFIETFTNLRIRENREFFNIKPEKALEIFQQVAMVIDDAHIEETYKTSLFNNIFEPSKETKTKSGKTPKRNYTKIWMIPANPKYFDIDGCLKDNGVVYWRQHFNFQTGDTVYIYVTSPDSSLKYKCLVEGHDLPFSSENDIDAPYFPNPDDYEKSRSYNRFAKFKLIERTNSERMTLVHLLENGMNAAPQGCLNLSYEGYKELLSYIENNF